MIERLLILCLGAAAVLAPAAAAQQPFPVSVDGSVGVRMGSGGSYVNRGGAAADLMVGVNLGRSGAGTLVGAVTSGAQTPMNSDLVCVLKPGGGCFPNFPVLFSVGALVGMSRPSAWASTTRVLAGPAYFRVEDRGGALGLQGRLDVSTPPTLHTGWSYPCAVRCSPGSRAKRWAPPRSGWDCGSSSAGWRRALPRSSKPIDKTTNRRFKRCCAADF